MANIRAFKGWRYSPEKTGESGVPDISDLCSPPYDVLDQAERDALAEKNPHNVVELELAPGALDLETPGNRYVTARDTWNTWVEQGVLAQDEEPSIYVLEQHFNVNGREYRRTCFIVEMDIYSFDEKVVIPHELTLPKALGDRYRLLSTMNVNTSQVLGLYSDPSATYQQTLDEVKSKAPVASAVDGQGVESSLWRVTDQKTIDTIVASLDSKQVFIADGHHRYTVAVAWRDKCRELAASAKADSDAPSGKAPKTDSVMIALANMDDPQLLILAYHRAVKAEGPLDMQAIDAQARKYFDITAGELDDLKAKLASSDKPAFIMVTSEGAELMELKDDADLDEGMPNDHSIDWKKLDVSVLHELLIKPMFGITPDEPETLARIAYSQDDVKLIDEMGEGLHDAVFVMRPTRMDQLQSVSLGGETMPQKSTFFYPKLPSGFVFRDMN